MPSITAWVVPASRVPPLQMIIRPRTTQITRVSHRQANTNAQPRIATRNFSSSLRLQADLEPSSKQTAPFELQHKKNTGNPNPELPVFSFEELGISKSMKFVLIGIISIFATMETWMYCTWIWRRWKGEAMDE
ncbi:hypothetical protein QQS21_000725 [Conoideocrella luteorostrata]|uniref:Uncharacterized protein n=1 Tax=Conoideocrella luteorostrata TaxID=1105319 RepID=A0AAJ0CY94_9HYPO|nr:hypothetical protein QQS21_000725 [Conoideocrella luteorostrata]